MDEGFIQVQASDQVLTPIDDFCEESETDITLQSQSVTAEETQVWKFREQEGELQGWSIIENPDSGEILNAKSNSELIIKGMTSKQYP